jgi:DNA repair exonuclease SbcCD nuclease subunit
MEGGLPADEVVRAARAALHWCFEQKADLVVLSGDITDSGREEEWQLLHGLRAGLSPTEAGRLLVIPGNHDLTITLETYPETDGRLVPSWPTRSGVAPLPDTSSPGAARTTRSPTIGRLRASGPSGSNGGASGRSSGRSCARATAPPPGGLAI